jgi:alanyl-tRNA synthetase
VIRRILRRAVRYAYTNLGFKEPFLNQLIPVLAKQFDGVFPELIAQQDFVQKVVLEEEREHWYDEDSGITWVDFTSIVHDASAGNTLVWCAPRVCARLCVGAWDV